MDSGVSTYWPNSFGRPALGWVLTRTGATRESSWTYGRSADGPSAQLSPMLRGRAWATEVQNASVVCPERVRPDASVMVPEIMTGTRLPSDSNTVSTAKIAALALSVSKMVSIRMMSAPPSSRAFVGLGVGRHEVVEPDVPEAGVVDVGRERRGAVGRTEHAGHEPRPVRLAALELVRRLARQGGGGVIQLADQALQAVVRLGARRAGERVGLDDVGARLEVGGMDGANDLGLGEAEEVAVALQLAVRRREPLAPVLRLAQAVGLDHRPHGPVEQQDPARQQRLEQRESLGAGADGSTAGLAGCRDERHGRGSLPKKSPWG